MSDAAQELLLKMQGDPLYPLLMEKIVGACPVVPEYNHSNDNTEEWKYKSAFKAGYELALLQFNIKLENEK